MAEGALTGLRVLDFTWVGAGSFTTRLLSEHGADVVKIESATHIDSLRVGPPFVAGVPGVNRSGYFAERNANKRSVTIDLKKPEGTALVRRLVERADVVANNFRPGVMEGFGLGYHHVSVINPSVIYLSMSMQGGSGPERNYLGYGITIAAIAGLTALSAEPGRYPVGTGTHYPDHVPNPGHAALAVLAALRHRRRTGRGQLVEIAQTEPIIAQLGPALSEWTVNHVNQQPTGNRDLRWFPHGVFPAAGEDRWVALVARTDDEWRALADELGITAPEAWATVAGRMEAADDVEAAVAAATRHIGPVEVMSRLQRVGVPAGLVATSADLVDDDPQLRHRGHWRYLDHPEMGRCAYGRAPFRLSVTDGALTTPAPLLGEHTRQVLASELGIDDAEIDRLTTAGVLS